ncbi:MAG: DUF1598 domain-containing protein [Planctomycetales bacterium]|nr:DUF1598 domain-containing protein [Planctomycetales bacterium]
MRRLSICGIRVAAIALIFAAGLSSVSPTWGQTATATTATGTTATGTTATGTTATSTTSTGQTPGGVQIDPQGVLRTVYADPRVTLQRLRAAKQDLPQHLAKPSPLRKVSLTRLESAVAKQLAEGGRPSVEMAALAGLTRLEYVFFYPESGDIVIAGSAEGFAQDALGRLVGVESGKPCLLLDDMIVALRAYSPSGDQTNTISVSIDPTQEGLERMQKTLLSFGGQFSGPADVPRVVNSLQQALGLNEVTIKGIPAGTHFAHVLTEADYRMKLIGIGLEAPPVPMASYVSKLTLAMTTGNSLIRWFFVPNYEAIAESEDGLAMKLVGNGVKLVGEDELVGRDGSRQSSGRKANAASRIFTSEFTKKFTKIADNSVVYSQLRNLVDMTIAAAYIQDRGMYQQADWNLGVFADEDQLPVAVLQAPRQVETAINAIMIGNQLVTPIGGGVTIQARHALEQGNLQADPGGQIKHQHDQVKLDGIAADRWWWD